MQFLTGMNEYESGVKGTLFWRNICYKLHI